MLQVTMRRLEVFVAVVETGRFGAAAAALNIAQPSVSAHISALEAKVGAPLFERQPGSPPRLTDNGRAVYNYAKDTLARASAVAADIAQTGNVLRFAAQRFVAQSLLSKPLEMFSAAYPKVELIAHSGTFEEVHGLFTSAAVDLAFLLSPGEIPGLQTTPIGRYRLAFIAAPDHPLARQTQIAPATLAQHAYVSPYRSSYFGRTLEAMLHEVGMPPPPVHSQAQELSMVREMVLAGRGFSLSMRRSVQKDLAAGTLVELDVDLPPLHLTLVYARNPRAVQRAIDSLVELVRKSEGQIA